MTVIGLKGVAKVFPNGVAAVAGIDLAVGGGELLAVVGPSGSGKSTLLRLIAGLEEPTAGSVWIDGRDVTPLPPRDRDVALAFQEPALYPYLTVFDNLAFGVRARRLPEAEVRARVREVAATLELSDVLGRRPATLSGGQRRRVALGRAVARRPRAFLFDEPLTGLDAPLRAAIRADLLDLHRRTGAPMILVTHDQSEALAVGDRVAVMESGRVVQLGAPREVYEHPATTFVAGFVGSPPMSLLTPRTDGALPGRLGYRAEHVAIARDDEPRDPALCWLPGTYEVVLVEFLGYGSIATVKIGADERLRARLPADRGAQPGERVAIGLDDRRATHFDGHGLAIPP